LLEKQGIYLPTPIFREKTLVKLEKALSSGIPIVVSNCYKEISVNLEKFIDSEKIKEIIGLFIKHSNDFERLGGSLTEDDRKIIEFMVKNSSLSAEDAIELAGPLYYLLKVYEDLTKEEIKSEYLKMFIMISTYIQLYELLLLQLDRRLCNYLRNNKKFSSQKEYKDFLNLERKYTKHATAGKINQVLHKLGVIEFKNSSVLDGELRELRNRFSHANFFYDPELKKIFAGEVQLTKEEFIGEFYRLFNFALTWFKSSINAERYEEAVDSFIRHFKNMLNGLSEMFRKIERSPDLKREFGSMVIQWKKEIDERYGS